jgi:archaellum component FlaC
MKTADTDLAKAIRSLAWILVLALVVLPSGACSAPARRQVPETGTAASTPQMTQEELQAAVISYANRFIATIGQAAFEFEEKVPTKEGRRIASARKVYSLSAVTEIAAGPHPGASLLDLVVVSTLNRIVWEEYWRPQVFGMPAEIMIDAFKKMEGEAWEMAAKVMTPEQMVELRELIMDWYYRNPGQVAVDYIQFSDFGDLGKKPNLKEIQKPGGLLAPVAEATRAVDEVRMTSERAMFLLTKMQVILGFQVEQVYKDLVMQPEVEKVLKDVNGFRKTTERFADLLENMPAHITAERQATLGEVSELVAQERTAVLNAFDDRQKSIRAIVKDVQATLDRVNSTIAGLQGTTEDVERLLAGTEKTALVFQNLVQSVDRLAARFESKTPKEPTEPLNIGDVTMAIQRLQETVVDLNELVLNVNKNSSPLVDRIADRLSQTTDARVDHVFWRLVELFAFIGVIVFILVLVHYRLRRPSGGSASP